MQQDIRKYYVPTKVTDANLSCNICKELALHPVECQKCENLFCKHCVEGRQKINKTCPMDCEGAFECKQPHRLVRDQFSKIQFYCINKPNGCGSEIRMDDVMNHSESCQYVPTKCICDWAGLKVKLSDHQKNCEHFQMQTCNLCKVEITRLKLKTHNCIHDLKEKLTTISEKFYDYKEDTDYSIKELKNQVRMSTDEITSLKGDLKKIRKENQQLTEAMKQFFQLLELQKNAQVNNAPQNVPNKPQQEEQDPLFIGANLTESDEMKCDNNHKLYFWKCPANDAINRQNKCAKCAHLLGNAKFAYVCGSCRIHFCLKCQNPELFYEKQQKIVTCPQKKLMKRFEDENFRCSVCEKKAESLIKPLALKCDDCGLIECFQCIKNKKYHSRQTILIFPDQSEGEIQVGNTLNVSELIDCIKQQNKDKKWHTYELELFFLDKLMPKEASINKIVYSPSSDYLIVQIKKGENLRKLKTFFALAGTKMFQKTQSNVQRLKNALRRSATLQPKTTEKKNVRKLLSFFSNASGKISQLSKQKTFNFTEKIKSMTSNQDPSRINQEEDPQKNNDTVLGLLDDLHHKSTHRKHESQQQKPKSLSPEAREYLQRKKKALENLKDPKQQAKAKLLVHELNKQRRLLEERKQKQLLNNSDQLEESIEKYKLDRQQMIEQQNLEKREKIKERLQEMQKIHEKKQKMNEQSKQLLSELKNREKEKKKQIEEKEEQLKKQYYEDAKVKLQQRKRMAVPIRLEEINKHEEEYMNKKQLLKLEKDQKKLEREITIQQETKQIYKAKEILQKVMEGDQKYKNKEVVERQQRAEKLLRKQKYAEIVKEYHKPVVKAQTDIQFSRALHNKSDHSIQDDYVDFLKEGEGRSNSNKNDQIKSRLIESEQDKNINKISSVLNVHKAVKTRITEQLSKGKMPGPSVYYNPKPAKTDLPQEEQPLIKKPKNYLKELEQERKTQQDKVKSESVPRFNKKQVSIKSVKKIEREAQRKEHEAFYLNDEKLKEEADQLFLQSVQEKLKFLEKNA